MSDYRGFPDYAYVFRIIQVSLYRFGDQNPLAVSPIESDQHSL